MPGPPAWWTRPPPPAPASSVVEPPQGATSSAASLLLWFMAGARCVVEALRDDTSSGGGSAAGMVPCRLGQAATSSSWCACGLGGGAPLAGAAGGVLSCIGVWAEGDASWRLRAAEVAAVAVAMPAAAGARLLAGGGARRGWHPPGAPPAGWWARQGRSSPAGSGRVSGIVAGAFSAPGEDFSDCNLCGGGLGGLKKLVNSSCQSGWKDGSTGTSPLLPHVPIDGSQVRSAIRRVAEGPSCCLAKIKPCFRCSPTLRWCH